MGFLTSCGMEHEVTLELQQGSQEFSGVVKGNSGFLLSYGGKLGVPLELQQWNQSSCRVFAGGVQCSSRGMAGNLGFLSCWGGTRCSS